MSPELSIGTIDSSSSKNGCGESLGWPLFYMTLVVIVGAALLTSDGAIKDPLLAAFRAISFQQEDGYAGLFKLSRWVLTIMRRFRR